MKDSYMEALFGFIFTLCVINLHASDIEHRAAAKIQKKYRIHNLKKSAA